MRRKRAVTCSSAVITSNSDRYIHGERIRRLPPDALDLRAGGLPVLFLAIEQRTMRAFRGEPFRNSKSDSGSASGNYCDAPLEAASHQASAPPDTVRRPPDRRWTRAIRPSRRIRAQVASASIMLSITPR